MNLKHLTDTCLLMDIKSLVGKEREITTKVLHHLKEIDRRKLYSDIKYMSLFDYAVKELGYSESSAQRRIQAARMLHAVPEIETKIEQGLLTLSNINEAAKFFKEQDIRKPSEKRDVLEKIQNLSRRACEKKLFEMSGKEVQTREETRRISKDSSKVTVILSDETLEKIQKLKDLMGKELSMDELISMMADSAIKEIEKKKFKTKSLPPAKKQSNKNQPASLGVLRQRTRYIASSVKRTAYSKSKSCVKCGSQKNLNFDHKIPFALGGNNSQENIRLLCFNCNQRGRIKAKL